MGSCPLRAPDPTTLAAERILEANIYIDANDIIYQLKLSS